MCGVERVCVVWRGYMWCVERVCVCVWREGMCGVERVYVVWRGYMWCVERVCVCVCVCGEGMCGVERVCVVCGEGMCGVWRGCVVCGGRGGRRGVYKCNRYIKSQFLYFIQPVAPL